MSLFLDTPRLFLRSLTLDDVKAIHAIRSDPDAMRYIASGPQPDIEVTRERIRKMMDFQRWLGYSLWAVVLKESGEVIGDCGLIPLERKGPDVELGCHIRKDWWGRGYATEASKACLRYGFTALELDEIVAVIVPENLASRRLAEKCGMRETGIGIYYGIEQVMYKIRRSDPAAQLLLGD